MDAIDDLAQHLHRLDGRGYKAYRAIEGAYDAGDFALQFDHVQGDPYAAPSRVRVVLPARTAALPAWLLQARSRRIAAADFLNRALHQALAHAPGVSGSGRSGPLHVLAPGQQVLERAAVQVAADGQVTARLRAGLPARGRRILGPAAARLLTELLPDAVRTALVHGALDAGAFRRHVQAVEDAEALRAALAQHGLVAFVADGARLPRR
ncbi:MAG TPA: ABC-ATPase domain-containing protein, partial [Longimicrobiales bacterium]|nr:ABC-ATPase domain-containing protein [Longimicrobiales bacterium]